MNSLLVLCFTISGATALVLEVLWMRSAGLVLGTTAGTTATVLACYFAGLGLGAGCARRMQRRPVRWYGLLEVGAGMGAAWSLAVFRALASDPAQAWLVRWGPIGHVTAVSLALFPATLCMGATLPALGQALAAAESVGRRGGLLYALHTLGGVLGAAVAGFGLPALIGVRASYGVAAGASLLVGATALIIGHGLPEVRSAREVSGTVVPALPRSRLWMVAAGAGALGLSLEVLWTRLFAQVLHNSTYSFTAIILVFLLALAAGAAVAALLLRWVTPATVASVALLTSALTTVGGTWLFIYWTDGLTYVGMASGLGEYVGRIVLLAAATAGPAAVASGAVLPALWAAWGGHDAAAHPLGELLAANMFGAVMGAITAGFLMVPTIGVRGGLLVAAVAYIVLADMVVTPWGRLRPLVYVVVLAVAIADPLRAPLVHLRSEHETLRAMAEGVGGIVTVVEASGDLQLRLDNHYVLGGTAAAANQRRQGLLPLLLHPDPRRLPEWSRDALFTSPQGLMMLYAGDLTSVTHLFGKAPLNTDDRPLIEFLAPQLTRVTAAGDKDWFIGETLAAFYDTLDARLIGTPDPYWPASDNVAAARRAGTALYQYVLAVAQQDDATAARLQSEVRRLVPEVILAAESQVPSAGLAEAREALVGLRAEQEQVHQRLEDMERRLREMRDAVEGPR